MDEHEPQIVNGEVPCKHQWVIDTSPDPTSSGRCKRCDALKNFPNTIGVLFSNATAREEIARYFGSSGASSGPIDTTGHSKLT